MGRVAVHQQKQRHPCFIVLLPDEMGNSISHAEVSSQDETSRTLKPSAPLGGGAKPFLAEVNAMLEELAQRMKLDDAIVKQDIEIKRIRVLVLRAWLQLAREASAVRVQAAKVADLRCVGPIFSAWKDAVASGLVQRPTVGQRLWHGATRARISREAEAGRRVLLQHCLRGWGKFTAERAQEEKQCVRPFRGRWDARVARHVAAACLEPWLTFAQTQLGRHIVAAKKLRHVDELARVRFPLEDILLGWLHFLAIAREKRAKAHARNCGLQARIAMSSLRRAVACWQHFVKDAKQARAGCHMLQARIRKGGLRDVFVGWRRFAKQAARKDRRGAAKSSSALVASVVTISGRVSVPTHMWLDLQSSMRPQLQDEPNDREVHEEVGDRTPGALAVVRLLASNCQGPHFARARVLLRPGGGGTLVRIAFRQVPSGPDELPVVELMAQIAPPPPEPALRTTRAQKETASEAAAAAFAACDVPEVVPSSVFQLYEDQDVTEDKTEEAAVEAATASGTAVRAVAKVAVKKKGKGTQLAGVKAGLQDESSSRVIDALQQLKASMVDDECLSQVLRCVSSSCPDVQLAALGALVTLTSDDTSICALVAMQGGIPLLLALESGPPVTSQAAARAVAALTLDEATATIIDKERGSMVVSSAKKNSRSKSRR